MVYAFIFIYLIKINLKKQLGTFWNGHKSADKN